MVWQFWSFWDVRRRLGGVSGISGEDWQKILDWAERNRAEPSLRLLYGTPSDGEAKDADEAATGPGAETEAPAASSMVMPATIFEQTRWL
jgi:hypothetical protein